MIKTVLARIQQKYRTVSYPKGEPVLPDRFCGRPAIDRDKCLTDCRLCIDGCPVKALEKENNALTLNMGRCLFCADCVQNCPTGAITFTRDYQLAARSKEELILRGSQSHAAAAMDKAILRILGRSLKLRQVSAGGCNACEADTNVLTTVVFDLGRFGIQFVASPRHADGLLITGPVTENMQLALKKTYDAVPDPKIVIAVGACAISGGIYGDQPQACKGAEAVVPVDLYIPGCPPHPLTILDGLLRLLGRIK